MDIIQKSIMDQIIEMHLSRYKGLMIKTSDDFYKNWMGKDFTNTFYSTLSEFLSTNEYNILLAFFNQNCNADQVANLYSIRSQDVNSIKDDSLFRLSNLVCFKKLYIGKEKFDELIKSKQTEIQDIAYGRNQHKKDWED